MDLDSIVKKLHNINFGENGLICLAEGDEYCVGKCKRKYGIEHVLPQSLEVCKNKNCQNCFCDDERMFTSVTHGTHTFDFLDAHEQDRASVEGWSKVPVLFVMENPAYPDASYKDVANGNRRVSKWWYWINRQSEKENEEFFYPKYFVQKEYGWMIYSVIRTFRMANAYVTNMVKCGMTGGDGYLTTDKYQENVVSNCLGVLNDELDCLRDGDKTQRAIVFAFGERTYNRLKKEWKIIDDVDNEQNVALYMLPHPANRLADDNRKYVLLGKILRALLKNNFYAEADMPNFEDILLRGDDKPHEVDRNHEKFCIKQLEELCIKYGFGSPEESKKYEKKYAIEQNIVTYEFAYRKDFDGSVHNEPDTLTLRQRVNEIRSFKTTNGEQKKIKLQVRWAQYDFIAAKIRLFVGTKKNTSDIEVADEDKAQFEIYVLIKELVNKYQIKYSQSDDKIQEYNTQKRG